VRLLTAGKSLMGGGKAQPSFDSTRFVAAIWQSPNPFSGEEIGQVSVGEVPGSETAAASSTAKSDEPQQSLSEAVRARPVPRPPFNPGPVSRTLRSVIAALKRLCPHIGSLVLRRKSAQLGIPTLPKAPNPAGTDSGQRQSGAETT